MAAAVKKSFSHLLTHLFHLLHDNLGLAVAHERLLSQSIQLPERAGLPVVPSVRTTTHTPAPRFFNLIHHIAVVV